MLGQVNSDGRLPSHKGGGHRGITHGRVTLQATAMQSEPTKHTPLVPDEPGTCGFRVSALQDKPGRDRRVTAAVARAQAGDSEAIRFLYVQYKDNVYGYVLSFVRDSA